MTYRDDPWRWCPSTACTSAACPNAACSIDTCSISQAQLGQGLEHIESEQVPVVVPVGGPARGPVAPHVEGERAKTGQAKRARRRCPALAVKAGAVDHQQRRALATEVPANEAGTVASRHPQLLHVACAAYELANKPSIVVALSTALVRQQLSMIMCTSELEDARSRTAGTQAASSASLYR
jgi:hypothetical protein